MECAPAFNYARSSHETNIIDAVNKSAAGSSDGPSATFQCSDHLNLDLRCVVSNGDRVGQVAPELKMDYLDLSERGHKGLGVALDFVLTEGQSITFVLREPPSQGEADITLDGAGR